MPRIWRATAAPSDAQIAEIATVLGSGGVVLLPTDTIYGLHAVASDGRAIDRLATIKGRDEEKPFVVIASSIEQVRAAGCQFPERAARLVEELWPGPLTVVLPQVETLPASRGQGSVAVRVPALPWLQRLVALTGPLASTSANLAGEPPIQRPQDLAENLRETLDGILDSGLLDGKPSTLVSFTGEPLVLREGDALFSQKVWKTLRKTL